MRVIFNNYIPFGGRRCVNIFGVVFARNVYHLDEVDLNHEAIHTAQMKELAYVGFYIIYFAEWLVRKIFCKHNAICDISFEKEAYNYQRFLNYLKSGLRDKYAQWRDEQ